MRLAITLIEARIEGLKGRSTIEWTLTPSSPGNLYSFTAPVRLET